MFIPAHVGISLGAVILLKSALPSRFTRWKVTFPYLCAAALLPDLVDKTLSLTVITGYHTSRLFAHTLLFSLLAAVVCHVWKKDWIPYAWIMLGHLVLDSNWTHPRTLLFPLLGFRFDRGMPTSDPLGYLRSLWFKYANGPEWVIPEIIGTAVIIIYFYGRVRFKPILEGPPGLKPEKRTTKRGNNIALHKGV